MKSITSRCSVDECGKPLKRQGLCYGHYMKKWRYGTPTPIHKSQVVDLVGRRYGILTVVQRDGERWELRCDCGATTFARAGDLNRGGKLTCGNKAVHYRRSDIGYEGAHQRVAADRGAASNYRCVDCSGGAQHWSYTHSDPDELVVSSGRNAGISYSVNPEFYDPRCVSCHKKFDLGIG